MEHVAGSFVFQVASSCRANGKGGKKCLLLYGIVEKISLRPLRSYPFESTTGNVASKGLTEPMLKCGFLCLKSILVNYICSETRSVIFQVESFILDQDDLENPMLETASKLLLSSTADGADLRTVDPETQARLEALLEAAGKSSHPIQV